AKLSKTYFIIQIRNKETYMIIAIGMMLLCIMLGGFMIRSCMGKTNSSSEAKQSISDVRKIIDKKELIKYKRRNQR
ncbi:hypothetical protein, partial [Klebsiella pneumoniae]|uniref:hypothetical protein n=2 Tax=Enterobacterales TaxID=91347 RepID=UPI000E3E9B9C